MTSTTSFVSVLPAASSPSHTSQTHHLASAPDESTWGDYFPTSQPTSTQGPGDLSHDIDSTTKVSLELVFVILAVLLISGVVWRRIRFLRRNDIPLRHFVSVRPFWSSRFPTNGRSTSPVCSLPRLAPVPRTTPAHWSRWSSSGAASIPSAQESSPPIMPHPAHLYSISLFPGSALPIASIIQPPSMVYGGSSSRRTRTARRWSTHGESDTDGWYDDKEMLPLYEMSGGPPGYNEAQERRDCPEDVMRRIYAEAPVLLSARVDNLAESLAMGPNGAGGGGSPAEERVDMQGAARTTIWGRLTGVCRGRDRTPKSRE